MLTAEQLSTFINQTKDKVLIAGYGSLLSEYSRKTFSQIEAVGLPVMVNGWQRGWITRSLEEQQTYVGATPNNAHKLNAHLISLSFDESFEKREQDYKFTLIEPANLELPMHLKGNEELMQVLENTPIYICETLQIEPSTVSFPVNYSYIHTCLTGCFEATGLGGIEAFFDLTSHWDTGVFNNDLSAALYPRGVPIDTSNNNPMGSLHLDIDEKIKYYRLKSQHQAN